MENTDIQPPQTCHLPEDSKQPDGVQLDNLDAAGRAKRDVNTTISTPKSWWKQHVAQEVPLEACRDYYALERTYLAWVRTSMKFAHFGILVAQLFRLPQEVLPNSPLVSPFFRLGKPLGIASIGLAIFTILVGGYRCWHQQHKLAFGRVQSSGWEIWSVVGFAIALVVAVIVLVVGDASSSKPL